MVMIGVGSRARHICVCVRRKARFPAVLPYPCSYALNPSTNEIPFMMLSDIEVDIKQNS
jgi:hypothetical protein